MEATTQTARPAAPQISNRQKREGIFRCFMHLTTRNGMTADEARADIAKGLNISVDTVNYAIERTILGR